MLNKFYVGDKIIESIYLGSRKLTYDSELDSIIIDIESENYIERGTWFPSSLLGYNDTTSRYTHTIGAEAVWSTYVSENSNYDVFIWIPESDNSASLAEYTITTLNGIWKTYVNQEKNGGFWFKLATVIGVKDTVLNVTLKSLEVNTRANSIKVVSTESVADDQYDPTHNQDTETIAIFANQSGYDTSKNKRATVTNVSDGSVFEVVRVGNNQVVYSGLVEGQIADFTDLKPIDSEEEYAIVCGGETSFPFKIKENYIQEISIKPALSFMAESRQDTFDSANTSGYGWRDSHQFSFELNSLVSLYLSDPSYFNNLWEGIYKIDECEYEELRVQNEPDIIWLMKFAVTRYMDWGKNKGIKLHVLVKAQLSYFLYVYPQISSYISEEFYTEVLEFTTNVWTETTSNKSWYEVSGGINHNLLTTQEKIGEVKGQLPIGYAVMPNLLMWNVAQREGLSNSSDYFDAFYNNVEWIVNDVDLDRPEYTKGQRMSEYITVTGLAYAYENYPELCPSGTYEKLERLADVFISRSNNLWDLRLYSHKEDITDSEETVWTGGGTMNEVGNVAGFPAISYALARIINDVTKQNRLKELATAHIDGIFGRNPFGRHYGYDAPEEIEGVDLGWFTKYEGGLGNLQYVKGRLDGSPKESAYPFNPSAPYGYTEGWVAFNTAWNTSLAYLIKESNS